MRKGIEFLLATLGNGEAKGNLCRFNNNVKEGSFQHTDFAPYSGLGLAEHVWAEYSAKSVRGARAAQERETTIEPGI